MLFKVGLMMLVAVLIVVPMVLAERAVMAIVRTARDVGKGQITGGIKHFDEKES